MNDESVTYFDVDNSSLTMLFSDTRQAVALNSFLEVAVLQGIFIKIPCKTATSKKLFKATACLVSENSMVKDELSTSKYVTDSSFIISHSSFFKA